MWCSQLRKALRKEYAQRLPEGTKCVVDRAPCMTLEDLCLIGDGLFAENTTMAMNDRTLMNFQWSVVGKISDIANLEFDDIQWEGDLMLLRILRKKVAEDQTLSIICSALIWEIDPLRSLAAQLIIDPYNTSTRVFPQVEVGESSDSGSGHINKILSALTSNSAPGNQLTPGLRSHSVRRGAATHAASNHGVSLADVSNRGKWNMDTMMKLFVYIAPTTKSDIKVVRVLSGWKLADTAVHAPQLASDVSCPARHGSEDSTLQQKFSMALFDKLLTRLRSHKFIFALTASLLMYFEETYCQYPAHKLHSKMTSVLRSVLRNESCGEKDAVRLLREWSIATRTRLCKQTSCRFRLVLLLPISQSKPKRLNLLTCIPSRRH